MARVAHRSGRRGGTIPGAVRADDEQRVGLLTSSPFCRSTMDTRGRTSMSARPASGREPRGVEGSVRRTAAVIAGALLLLTGCNDGGKSGDNASGGSSAPPAQVA